MNVVNIKPLSVNKAWKGRRYKTLAYKNYEQQVLTLLPQRVHIPDGKLELHLEFGFSSPLADFDNPVKLFVDCLQKKYRFNDRRIRRAIIDVDDSLNKGDEFVAFKLLAYKKKG